MPRCAGRSCRRHRQRRGRRPHPATAGRPRYWLGPRRGTHGEVESARPCRCRAGTTVVSVRVLIGCQAAKECRWQPLWRWPRQWLPRRRPAHLPTRLICLPEILVPLSLSSRSTAVQSCCEERSRRAVSLPMAACSDVHNSGRRTNGPWARGGQFQRT
eukprot:scaffold79590_cov45-Phaeocystis_antarctica.AAC.1